MCNVIICLRCSCEPPTKRWISVCLFLSAGPFSVPLLFPFFFFFLEVLVLLSDTCVQVKCLCGCFFFFTVLYELHCLVVLLKMAVLHR